MRWITTVIVAVSAWMMTWMTTTTTMNVQAQPAERVVMLHSSQTETHVGTFSSVAIDTSRAWKIDNVLHGSYNQAFQPVHSDAPNFGVITSAVWLRVRLYNTDSVNLERLLLIDDYYITTIDLFITKGTSILDHHTNGFVTPFSAREIPNRLPLFRLHLPPRDTLTLYLRCTCELTMSLPISIIEEQTFIVHDRQTQVWIWLYFGIIGAMFAYNAFLFFTLRSATYLLYILYVASMGGFMFLGSNGLGVEYLEYLNISSVLHYRLICAFGIATIVWQVGFTTRFLRTSDNHTPLTSCVDAACTIQCCACTDCIVCAAVVQRCCW